MKEISPGVTAAIIVVVLLVAGGLWYFSTKGPMGVPDAGHAGRSDPFLGGPNSILKQKGAVNPMKAGARSPLYGTPPPGR